MSDASSVASEAARIVGDVEVRLLFTFLRTVYRLLFTFIRTIYRLLSTFLRTVHSTYRMSDIEHAGRLRGRVRGCPHRRLRRDLVTLPIHLLT